MFEAGISKLFCKLELCGRIGVRVVDLSGKSLRRQQLKCEKKWKKSICPDGIAVCWSLGGGAVLTALQVRLESETGLAAGISWHAMFHMNLGSLRRLINIY